MATLDVNGVPVRLQVVFQALSGDELNHLWSTQGDTAYRPSVAYEIALGPIVPSELGIGSPLVGAIGAETHATMEARYAPFSGTAMPPPVTATTVETRLESWAPRICFVHANACAQSLALALGSVPASLAVWVAGETSTSVSLRWEVWDTDGWRQAGPTLDTTPISSGIDPEAIPNSGLVDMGLAFTDHAGQGVLYAVHTYTRASDLEQAQVRSNPLLVTLF